MNISQPQVLWENERLLLKIIKEKLGITDEDMRTPDVVKQKVREANINTILS
jgi:hypothetical protein